LGDLVELAFDAFRRESDSVSDACCRRYTPIKILSRRLAESVSVGSAPRDQAGISLVAPFSKQLFIDKDVRNLRLAASLRTLPIYGSAQAGGADFAIIWSRLVGVARRLPRRCPWRRPFNEKFPIGSNIGE